MELHLVSENPVSYLFEEHRNMSAKPPLTVHQIMCNRVTPADTHAFEHVYPPVFHSAFISSYPVVYHCHM